jgi:predicted transcriptional regulator
MARRKKETDGLTPLELQMMQVLWTEGPSDVQTVQRHLPEGMDLAYTTVQTMLNVLARKGKVKRKLKGRAYEYYPVLTKEKAAGQAVREVVERLFGGSSEDLVMSLIKDRKVDAARIVELSKEIETLKKRSGDE